MGEAVFARNMQNSLVPPMITTQILEDEPIDQEVQAPEPKPRTPEPRRRKYSFASVKRMLEKKSEESKENNNETKERKAMKKESQQKKGMFHTRSNKQKQDDEEVKSSVLLIPPVPCQLGYNDLLVEEVSKPRASTVIHVSDDTLLTDVQRPRSPRNPSPNFTRKETRSKSDPLSLEKNHSQNAPRKFGTHLSVRPYGDYEGDRTSKGKSNLITNSEIRSIAQDELNSVLKGQFFRSKQVPIWSKLISERILQQVQKVTNYEKKIVTSVFIGEKFPGTVDVFVSCLENSENDTFETVSTQMNDIYAWVSVMGLKI